MIPNYSLMDKYPEQLASNVCPKKIMPNEIFEKKIHKIFEN